MRKIFIAIYSLILLNYIGLMSKYKNWSIFKSRKLLKNKLLSILNIKIKIDNKSLNNLKKAKNQQILLISNHRSILDPIIIQEVIQNNLNITGYWLAKEDLYKSPFFGFFTRNAGTILVPKKSNSKTMLEFMKNVNNLVKNEFNSIFIFPEGTKNKTNKKLLQFEKAATLISLKNKIDILPIYIEDESEKILKKALNKNKENIINIKIGKLISYKEAKKMESLYQHEFDLKG